jgi:hypothetical protein
MAALPDPRRPGSGNRGKYITGNYLNQVDWFMLFPTAARFRRGTTLLKKAVAGTNLEQARSHNRRVVIEAIRTNGALSRANIARLTALSSVLRDQPAIRGAAEEGGVVSSYSLFTP